MADNAVGEGERYWAFISYSHKDAAFGRRLHRRLESYALPRRLVGRAQGALPARLAPIFRDRDELPAAHDLSAEVRAALQASRSLVVVCSPAAAASSWVTREVELFRALHPDRPVLAAIATGEPADAFPAILRHTAADGAMIEPLAADFRGGGDGARLALLKLVAGIAGIGLDELIQRDAQRNLRRVTAVTAGALIAMLVMGLLTIFAFNARSEAERQQAKAEGLVEFMLTDLRDRLKGVGRLDVMQSVNKQALDYYSNEDSAYLPLEAQGFHARVLHAIGEDDTDHGNYDAALVVFHEAQRITAPMLAEAPNDPSRVYNHAQSVYWLGYVDFQNGRYAAAKPRFEEYLRLAQRLMVLTPNDPHALRELGFAEGNVCSVALKNRPRDLALAMTLCKASVQHMEAAAKRLGHPPHVMSDVANRHGWLADVYLAGGDHENFMTHRLIQEHILSDLKINNPMDMDNLGDWVRLSRVLARDDVEHGKPDQARTRLQDVLKTNEAMVQLDPGNKTWARDHMKILRDLNSLH